MNTRGGMRTFLTIWLGQIVSVTGSGMTRFALLIWAYDQTQAATDVALLGFAAFFFYVLFSPFAGVLVDRWDRRVVMLAADGVAGIGTALILLLFAGGALQFWHVFVYEAVTGAMEAFQLPAFASIISVLVPAARRGRINGLRTLGHSITRILAPALGALVLGAADLRAVLLIDLATFAAAYGTLLWVRVPPPAHSAAGQHGRGSVIGELRAGLRYLRAHRGLLYLILLFTGINFIASLTYMSIMPTMILARTGGDEATLATVQGMVGLSSLIGAVGVTLLIGRGRLVRWIVVGGVLSFLFGDLLMGMSQVLAGWLAAAFVTEFFVPFIFNAQRTILQNKVPPDLQGRVFALDGALRDLIVPFGYLIAGPLADHVFEPAMARDGALAAALGGLWGTGPGAGMGVMYLFTAVLGASLCALAWVIPSIRNVETDIPDYQEEAAGMPAAPSQPSGITTTIHVLT
ncbi:MAG: MFS transporter [Anaerolineae bacterium]|nr:MFS transporter [Anaerolineae bacterium]